MECAECVTSPNHFRALDYTASRTRSSHGERSEILSVVGKKRSVILLSTSPVHKVVSCRARPLEESNWTAHVSERAARLPKAHSILGRVLNERIVEVVARRSRVPLHCNSLADAQLCHWAKVPIPVSPLFMDTLQHAETQNPEYTTP